MLLWTNDSGLSFIRERNKLTIKTLDNTHGFSDLWITLPLKKHSINLSFFYSKVTSESVVIRCGYRRLLKWWSAVVKVVIDGGRSGRQNGDRQIGSHIVPNGHILLHRSHISLFYWRLTFFVLYVFCTSYFFLFKNTICSDYVIQTPLYGFSDYIIQNLVLLISLFVNKLIPQPTCLIFMIYSRGSYILRRR